MLIISVKEAREKKTKNQQQMQSVIQGVSQSISSDTTSGPNTYIKRSATLSPVDDYSICDSCPGSDTSENSQTSMTLKLWWCSSYGMPTTYGTWAPTSGMW